MHVLARRCAATASCHPATQQPRPLRTFHCLHATCGRCVVRYDHHSLWIANCVGVGNHLFFLAFLLFSHANAAGGAVLLSWWCVRVDADRLWSSTCALVALALVASIASALYTGPVLWSHLRNASRNLTSQERLLAQALPYLRGDRGEFVNPFDHGTTRNWRELLKLSENNAQRGYSLFFALEDIPGRPLRAAAPSAGDAQPAQPAPSPQAQLRAASVRTLAWPSASLGDGAVEPARPSEGPVSPRVAPSELDTGRVQAAAPAATIVLRCSSCRAALCVASAAPVFRCGECRALLRHPNA